jgi:hypothetical protein
MHPEEKCIYQADLLLKMNQWCLLLVLKGRASVKTPPAYIQSLHTFLAPSNYYFYSAKFSVLPRFTLFR